MTSELLSIVFVTSILAAMVRIATPILLAAIGELIAERSGVMNLGVEGTMLMGAFVGFVAAHKSGSLWLAVGLAIVAGALMATLMAFMATTLKVNQTVTGLAINLFASGVTFYWYRVTYPMSGGTSLQLPTIEVFKPVPIPVLSKIPVLGEALFSQYLLTYFALLMVAVAWFFLYRTRHGLELRCLGENPRAIDTKGLSVSRRQYLAVIFGGMMAGLGGAFLTLATTGLYVGDMTAGRGWLAIVIVIAGNWTPFSVLLASLVFAFLDAFQLQAQGIGVPVPYQFLLALPYLVAIIVLTVARSRSQAPAHLGLPYLRE